MLIQELARAKVNLTLQVLGRRPDGYHALASVVAFASAADVVTLDTASASAVNVTGPFAPKLASEYLITRTLNLLQSHHPDLTLGAVRLEKRLPIAAGIGGGSADAAAVLRAVRRANPHRAALVDWHGLAASLGADVPVCLTNELSFMTGIGDQISPMSRLAEPLAAILVNPRVAVPSDKTAQVFRALQALPLPSMPPPQPPRIADPAEAVSLIARVGNDLEAPAQAIMPVVAGVLAALRAAPGCRVARMSGAGPTCFAVFADAERAARVLRSVHPDWWIETVTLN